MAVGRSGPKRGINRQVFDWGMVNPLAPEAESDRLHETRCYDGSCLGSRNVTAVAVSKSDRTTDQKRAILRRRSEPMATLCVPSIGPCSYEAIKQLCSHLMPMSFDKWRNLQDEGRRASIDGGDVTLAIVIGEIFKRYCKIKNLQPDPNLLQEMAAHLAGEQEVELPVVRNGR